MWLASQKHRCMLRSLTSGVPFVPIFITGMNRQCVLSCESDKDAQRQVLAIAVFEDKLAEVE